MARIALSEIRSTTSLLQVSPTPVIPVTPESVLLPQCHDSLRRDWATTRSPSFQIDDQVTVSGVRTSAAVNLPHPS